MTLRENTWEQWRKDIQDFKDKNTQRSVERMNRDDDVLTRLSKSNPKHKTVREHLRQLADKSEVVEKTIKASGILNTWQTTQGAFLDISHITNQLQSINNWEDMVIWASKCGLTGIDINLLCQEYCRNLTMFLNVWKVATSCIEPGSNNRNDVIKWFRQYKKDISDKQKKKRTPEEVLKELEELI